VGQVAQRLGDPVSGTQQLLYMGLLPGHRNAGWWLSRPPASYRTGLLRLHPPLHLCAARLMLVPVAIHRYRRPSARGWGWWHLVGRDESHHLLQRWVGINHRVPIRDPMMKRVARSLQV
jgi:hypothetical protein